MNLKRGTNVVNLWKDLTGEKFNRLTVVGPSGGTPKRVQAWACICECGKTTIVPRSKLITGTVKSCGCFKKDAFFKQSTGRKYSEKLKYMKRTYYNMRSRTKNPKNNRYVYYGNKGITVEWSSFCEFYIDMHEKWEKGLTIDRINNEGNYCKENCRWANKITQANNKSTTRHITINNETRPLQEWCRFYAIPEYVVRGRLERGWDTFKAFTTKTGNNGGKGSEKCMV
jgi:hypothetical protein